MNRPSPHLGLRHLALFVVAFDDTKRFYTELLGFDVEWEPDLDNAYLTSGSDNLALHRASAERSSRETALDHLGLLVREAEDVDAWARFLETQGVTLATQPRAHRDGARSFYVDDPDGNRIQFIYHPPISGQGSSLDVGSD
jgi:catechol 2,3-dioxygenase-like lactoylglutathione lyase family enzyme